MKLKESDISFLKIELFKINKVDQMSNNTK